MVRLDQPRAETDDSLSNDVGLADIRPDIRAEISRLGELKQYQSLELTELDPGSERILAFLLEHLREDKAHDAGHALRMLSTVRLQSTAIGWPKDEGTVARQTQQTLVHDIGYAVYPGDRGLEHCAAGAGLVQTWGPAWGIAAEDQLPLARACRLHDVHKYAGQPGYLSECAAEHAAVEAGILTLQQENPPEYTELLMVIFADLLDQGGREGVHRSISFQNQKTGAIRGQAMRYLNGTEPNVTLKDDCAVSNAIYWAYAPYRNLEENAGLRQLLTGEAAGTVDHTYGERWIYLFEQARGVAADNFLRAVEEINRITHVMRSRDDAGRVSPAEYRRGKDYDPLRDPYVSAAVKARLRETRV